MIEFAPRGCTSFKFLVSARGRCASFRSEDTHHENPVEGAEEVATFFDRLPFGAPRADLATVTARFRVPCQNLFMSKQTSDSSGESDVDLVFPPGEIRIAEDPAPNQMSHKDLNTFIRELVSHARLAPQAESDLDDLAQDVRIRLLKSPEDSTFSSRDHLEGVILKIANSVLVDQRRAAGALKRSAPGGPVAGSSRIVSGLRAKRAGNDKSVTRPSEAASDRELQVRFAAALGRLTDEDREFLYDCTILRRGGDAEGVEIGASLLELPELHDELRKRYGLKSDDALKAKAKKLMRKVCAWSLEEQTHE